MDTERWYYFTAAGRYVGKLCTTEATIRATWVYLDVTGQQVTLLSPKTRRAV